MADTINMKVNFYATFRPLVGGKTIVLSLPEGSTLGQLVERLVAQYPALGPALFEDHGTLFPHVHLFVNGRDAPYLPDAMETTLNETDMVDIFPPVGGGSSLHSFSRELRSMPIWLLRTYLEELGGRVSSDDCISGDGWQARLTQEEDYVIGSLRVGQVRLDWQGDDQALQTIWPILEQKLARAGG